MENPKYNITYANGGLLYRESLTIAEQYDKLGSEEYRPWLTHYRGPFLVHANKAVDKEEVAEERSRLARKGIVLPDELPRGGIVGVVTLVDCVRDDDDSLTQRLLDRLFGQEPPCYRFILQDPRPLPFKPYRGQQKFFNVPDDLDGLEIDF